MKRSSNAIPNPGIHSLRLPVALALGILLAAAAARAQSSDAKLAEIKAFVETNQTVFLRNSSQQNDLNDIQTDLRNMFPRLKIYGIQSQTAISMRGTPDDLAEAVKLIAALDQPRKTYRLTYTVTETESGKPAGAQHFALIVANGDRQVFKQGSRVPIFVGTTDTGAAAQTSQVGLGAQVQYQDVGLRIESTVNSVADGVLLRFNVERSSVAEEKSGVGAQDPVIRETLLEGTSTLMLGKPLVLGALDIPGSTRKMEVQAVAELVK